MGYKVNKIRVGTQQVRPVWKPNANTIFYYPLENNVNDYSGNNRNGTIRTGSLSYTTSGGTKNVAQFNGNTIFSIPNIAGTYSTYTFNVWCKSTSTNTWQEMFDNYYVGNTNNVYFNFNGTSYELGGGLRNFAYQYRPNGGSNTYQNVYGTTNRDINTWYNVVVTSTSNGIKIYVNGTQVASNSTSGTIILNDHRSGGGGTHIGGRYRDNPETYMNYFYGYMSEFIFEGVTWTATDVSNYYNRTKSNYGL